MKVKKFGGPHKALYDGGIRYPAKGVPGEEGYQDEAIFLFFKLLDGTGRRLPMKHYFTKLETIPTKLKALNEALEVLGFEGHYSELTNPDEQIEKGTPCLVKPWLRYDGTEFESVTYVNRLDGTSPAFPDSKPRDTPGESTDELESETDLDTDDIAI